MSESPYRNLPGFKEKGGTSKEAAARMQGRAELLRNRCYAILGGGNFTADEVATVLGESILSVRPRISELGRMGLAFKTTQRRINKSGMSAVVWSALNHGPQMPVAHVPS